MQQATTERAEKKDEKKVEKKEVEIQSDDGAEETQTTVDLSIPPKKKEELYRRLSTILNAKVKEYFIPVQQRVKEQKNLDIKMRQVFGDVDARDLVVKMWEGFFDILLQKNEKGEVEEGSVGLPAGFGSLKLATAGATKKKTPQGMVVEVSERWRIKYAPGQAVDDRLSELTPPPPRPKKEKTETVEK